MSGVVSYLNRIFSELTTILLIPFRKLPPLAGLIWLSVLAGMIIILIFRWLTDQEEISRLRKKMGAQVLGMLLYLSNPRTVLSMAGKLILSNFRYLWLILWPLVVIAVPYAVLLGQADARYSTVPPGPEDNITITLTYDDHLPSREEFSAMAGNAQIPEPPVFVPALNEISFRIRPTGHGVIVVETAGISFPVGPVESWSGALSAREFDAGNPFSRLFRPWNVRSLIINSFVHSPSSGQVFLSPLGFTVLGGRWSWLAVLLVFSSLSALAGAVIFRVRV
jgi:uncharacterized protein YggT (Ycf19 family)